MPNRTIGSYELLQPLGQGAMGQVFRGKNISSGEQVAIKVLRPELMADDVVLARFLKERTLMVSLRHPNLVAVNDLIVENGSAAIVMEYLSGGDLRTYLRAHGTLSPAEAFEIISKVTAGLAYVHECGVTHRDIKPENVLRTATGEIKITDFGVARLASGQQLTRMTSIVGTPDYLAPEVVESETASPSSDIYSAGITLYELISGLPPFSGGHPVAVLRRHLEMELPTIPGLDPKLMAAIATMLAKDPVDRPDAADLSNQLAQLAKTASKAPLSPMQRPAKELPGSETTNRGKVAANSSTLLGEDEGEINKTVLVSRKRVTEPDIPVLAPPITPVKKKLNRKLIVASLVSFSLLAGLGLKLLGGVERKPDDSQIKLSSLRIISSTHSLKIGANLNLLVSGNYENQKIAQQKELRDVRWSSSNKSVARVNERGSVRGLSRGQVTIEATKDGVRASLKLNVANEEFPSPRPTRTLAVKPSQTKRPKPTKTKAVRPTRTALAKPTLTLRPKPAAKLPSAPTNVRAKASSESITVTWNRPSTNGGPDITSYKVIPKTGNRGCVIKAPATRCVVTGLSAGKSYSFSVVAINQSGNTGPQSSFSNSTTFSTAPTRPSAPRQARNSVSMVKMSWLAGSNNGAPIDSFELLNVKTGKTCTSRQTSCIVSGLIPATSYSFKVRAHNSKGWSPWSAIGIAKTATPPRTVNISFSGKNIFITLDKFAPNRSFKIAFWTTLKKDGSYSVLLVNTDSNGHYEGNPAGITTIGCALHWVVVDGTKSNTRYQTLCK